MAEQAESLTGRSTEHLRPKTRCAAVEAREGEHCPCWQDLGWPTCCFCDEKWGEVDLDIAREALD